MADPGGRPPGPDPVLGFFEFFREREGGEAFCFQRLTEAFIGADSRDLEYAPLAAYRLIDSTQTFC